MTTQINRKTISTTKQVQSNNEVDELQLVTLVVKLEPDFPEDSLIHLEYSLGTTVDSKFVSSGMQQIKIRGLRALEILATQTESSTIGREVEAIVAALVDGGEYE